MLNKAVKRIGSIRGLTRILKGVSRNTVKSWLYFENRSHSKTNLPSFIRLDVLFKILKIASSKLSINRLEKHVTHIRTRGGGVVGKAITIPKLPLKEGTQVIRVLVHLICDGFASDTHTPCYYNTDIELLEEFEKDLQVFGNVPTHRKGYKLSFPRIITRLLKHIYKIEFDSYNSTLPKILFSSQKLAKESIESYIDDEGSVYDDKIVIHSVNRVLLSQLRNLILKFKELPKKPIGLIERIENRIYLKLNRVLYSHFMKFLL